MTTNNPDKLKELVESSNKVLVVSHISPDPDAVSSLLLTGSTLRSNFPSKEVRMVLEEKTEGLDFIYGYQDIEFQTLDDAVEDIKPDLVILVDGQPNFDRFSRHGAESVRQYLKQSDAKLAVLDHHEPIAVDTANVLINEGYIACVQQVYKALFNDLKLKKPTSYAETTMLGLYSDSGGFVYKDKHHVETFRLASELVNAGADIELIANTLNSYTDEHLLVLAELMKNVSSGKDYSYTYLSDEFVSDWLEANRDEEIIRSACGHFTNNYIRNIDGRKWGFLARPDLTQGKGFYAASFRSVSGVKDVAALAKKLGGGGHKASAGVKDLKADTIKAVVDKIRQTIEATA